MTILLWPTTQNCLVVLSLLAPCANAQVCGVSPELVNLGSSSGETQLLSNAPEVGGQLSYTVSGGEPGVHGCLVVATTSNPTTFPTFGVTVIPSFGDVVVGFNLDHAGNRTVLELLVPLESCGVPLFAQALLLDSRVPSGVGVTNAVQQRIGVPQLSIESGMDTVVFEEGSTRSVASGIHVASGSTIPITKTTVITPATGLSLTEDYPSGGYVANGTSVVLSQTFSSLSPGEYTVTNTVDAVGQSLSAESSFALTVLPTGGAPVVFPLGSVPDAIQAGRDTSVVFTARVADYRVAAPEKLALLRVEDGVETQVDLLLDDGVGGDLVAGDGVYSGSYSIPASSSGLISFLAQASFPGTGRTLSTPIHNVVVTDLATDIAPSDLSALVHDADSGLDFVHNEVLAFFGAPQADAGLQALEANQGATLVGAVPSLGFYQFQIANPAGNLAILLSRAAGFASEPGVLSAGPNPVAAVQGFTPNDTLYGQQYAPSKVRADEAWYIARGGVLIAVVDTGVDFNHPDLVGKVLPGRDYINDDNDPSDDHGHGTACAGIAAALGNNSQGVAGAAWASKVLAIKIQNAMGKGPLSAMAAGIRAAADGGATVINCSCGFSPPAPGPETAAVLAALEFSVNYASNKGSLCVFAAGNDGINEVDVPGAFPSSFCVGATDASDDRWVDSNFGPEVDVAAPGASILSTDLNGTFATWHGTSFSTPLVSGCAALIWSRFPSLSASDVRERLIDTCKPLPGLSLGAGRIDVFEACFNGDFENKLVGWETTGTAGSLASLGPIMPTTGDRMGVISAPASSLVSPTTSVSQELTIQADVTSLDITFDYDFITADYPELTELPGSKAHSFVRISLIGPNDTVFLVSEFAGGGTELSFTEVQGIVFPDDDTVGHTGWTSVSRTVPVTPGTYRFVVETGGVATSGSMVLIDNIQFRL